MRRTVAQLLITTLIASALMVIGTIGLTLASNDSLVESFPGGFYISGLLLITMGAFSLREGGVAEVPDWYFRWGGSYLGRDGDSSGAVLTTFGASLIVGVLFLVVGVLIDA